MRKIILLALAISVLTACTLTAEEARKFTDDQLCSRIGAEIQYGNTTDVTVLLNEFKTRRESINQTRCQILELTGENSALPMPYYNYMYNY